MEMLRFLNTPRECIAFLKGQHERMVLKYEILLLIFKNTKHSHFILKNTM